MLEGKNVNLRVVEKEDIPLLTEWWTSLEFLGENFSPIQRSRTETEKTFLNPIPLNLEPSLLRRKMATKSVT